MPTTASDSMPLSQPLPTFSLLNVVTGKPVSNLDLLKEKKALLVIFLCCHCPYVVHIREELLLLATEYQPRGVQLIGISSNDPEQYPDDAPEKLKEMAEEHAFPFPILFDKTQEVAQAFSATCTPEFFIFNSSAQLAYHGRLDDSTPGNGRPVTGKDLRSALNALLTGKAVTDKQMPSMGCSIKWA